MTPAQAAEILGISVATLRKYSLIVEHATDNSGYFERNKQNNRLYTQKNIDDFNKMVELGHGPKMTLQTAAQQIYPTSAEQKKSKTAKKSSSKNSEVAALENTIKELRANIDQQDRVIENLSKKLIKLQEKTDSPASDGKNVQKDKKYQEYLQKVRDAKAKKEKAVEADVENTEKEGIKSKLNTLVNMQVSDGKKNHWWNKFIK